MSSVNVTSFYRFLPLSEEQVEQLQSDLETLASRFSLQGLCLLGREGINATISGSVEGLAQLKELVSRSLNVQDIHFKDSVAAKHPFHIFRIKIKDEIVTLGKPGFAPSSTRNNHLSPEEWDRALRDPNTIVLDTRNDYEVQIGKFKNARDFALKEFREFPDAVRSSGLDKSKRILMYCTGGIRCEKAILEMNEQGYNEVYQLDGGILNYLEKFPNKEFEGECFVFDYRVAVDQNLQPTQKYRLCPHCGQPADKPITCVKCGSAAVICNHCTDPHSTTCSKNCAHHVSIGSSSKRVHRQELTKRHKI